MKSMKKMYKALVMSAVVGLIGFGCSSEQAVAPRGTDPSLMAQGPGDTVHDDPDTICGIPALGNIVDTQGNLGSGNIFGADTYGTWELITTPQEMVLQVSLARGWFVSAASVYMGDGQAIPRDNYGNVDAENLPLKTTVLPVRNVYEVTWPISPSMSCPNAVWTCARFVLVEQDFLGNSFNDTQVWLEGQSADNAGAQYISYCAESCSPVTPPCSIPTPGPGDDLSAYECGNGNGQTKVTVCHIPPGNPSNMQEICIAVSALPAHIIEFKPANNPGMGHHSGCHIGPCDPCGPGSTQDHVNNGGGGSNGGGGNNGGGNGGNGCGNGNGGNNGGGWGNGGNNGGNGCGNGNGGWGGNGGNNGGNGCGNGNGGNNGGWGGNGGNNGGNGWGGNNGGNGCGNGNGGNNGGWGGNGGNNGGWGGNGGNNGGWGGNGGNNGGWGGNGGNNGGNGCGNGGRNR